MSESSSRPIPKPGEGSRIIEKKHQKGAADASLSMYSAGQLGGVGRVELDAPRMNTQPRIEISSESPDGFELNAKNVIQFAIVVILVSYFGPRFGLNVPFLSEVFHSGAPMARQKAAPSPSEVIVTFPAASTAPGN